MWDELRYRLRKLRYYTLPLSVWWSDLRFHWYRLDKGNLVFYSLLGLPVAAVGFALYSTVESHSHDRDLMCLALNVYYEARGEPLAGQYAVAEVTMNRVASQRFPDTVCQVVYQKTWDPVRHRYVAAFSWTGLNRPPEVKSQAWQTAWDAAKAVYFKEYPQTVQGALFYHAKYIRPGWARGKRPVARIGDHIFYR